MEAIDELSLVGSYPFELNCDKAVSRPTFDLFGEETRAFIGLASIVLTFRVRTLGSFSLLMRLRQHSGERFLAAFTAPRWERFPYS